MSSFYNIDAANARIPAVRELLLRLREEREELIRLRDRLIEIQAPGNSAAADDAGLDPRPDGRDVATDRPIQSPPVAPDEETRLIRLRMQGVIDQMQASVAKIDAWGISLRDIDTGLIDFPALVSGRQVWLCWRLGEGDIDWWHDLNVGFAGRRPLVDLA